MPNNPDLSSANVRILVLYRVEPGCLGPDGKSFIEDFCVFANDTFKKAQNDSIEWLFQPRYDKTLPEIQYQFNNRNLTKEMAFKFFKTKAIDIEHFEELLNERLASLIDKFLDR